MDVTPPPNVRRFVEVGVSVVGDGDAPEGDEREGSVRASQDFRVRSSPPVGFIARVRIVHEWTV